MENARAVTKGLLWLLAAAAVAIVAAGVYASVHLGEVQWIFASLVVLIIAALITATFLGSVTLLNLAVFAPILWLANKIANRRTAKTNDGT